MTLRRLLLAPVAYALAFVCVVALAAFLCANLCLDWIEEVAPRRAP